MLLDSFLYALIEFEHFDMFNNSVTGYFATFQSAFGKTVKPSKSQF